jgi:RNA polymerase sigma-70 factor (ECF subfamily)
MDSNSPTDAELVTESLAGQREPFGRLYDRYARIVAAVVAGVSGDWNHVDDMTQECFLRAFRKLSTLRDRTRFGPWVVGIARQVGRERRRSLRRDRHSFRDPLTLVANDTSDVSNEFGDQDEFDHIMRHVAVLDENERIAIHAYFLDEQNAATAAERLGLSRSGFYATLERAVARLAQQLTVNDSERLKR